MSPGIISNCNVKQRFAILLIIGLSACVSLSKQQPIDFDVNHWDHYAISEGTATVGLKIPPGFRTFKTSLPEPYNGSHERLILEAQYDYGAKGSYELAEFMIQANFIHLDRPLDAQALDANSLDGALREVFAKPVNGAHSPPPTLEQVEVRKWLYYDNLADVTFGSTHEIYCTVIDAQTVLFLSGWYGDKIRKDAKWLDSRRQILKDVRDRTSINPT
jgi:hypothetical protein